MTLQIRQRGVLDNLELAAVDRRPPEPEEVEIRVAASGLNFRDVLAALAMILARTPVGRRVRGPRSFASARLCAVSSLAMKCWGSGAALSALML